MKRNNYFLIILLILFSCETGEIKIIKEKHFNGNAQTIHFFNNKNDANQNASDTNIGRLIAINKPISFRKEQFYEDGKQAVIGKYENGLAHGLWLFFNKNGSIKSKSYYNKGYSVDTIFCYSEKGNLKRIVIEIDKAKKYWHSIDYYDSGTKRIEYYKYTDTLGYSFFDGPYKEWHENGQLKEEAILKMGSSTGKWTTWDNKGNIIITSHKTFTIGID
jgi:antitoxin component YwqK of YwqJK toxin-antitoxin module